MAGTALAGEPVLTVEPCELRGVPGAPLRAELTVTTPDAKPVRLLIPETSNLVLRAVEKIPLQRTGAGLFVQRRIVIWQGVEAGQTVLTNLTAGIGGVQYIFPNLGITVDAVPVAPPPEKITPNNLDNPPRPAATPPVEGNTKGSMRDPLLWRGAGTAGWVLCFQKLNSRHVLEKAE